MRFNDYRFTQPPYNGVVSIDDCWEEIDWLYDHPEEHAALEANADAELRAKYPWAFPEMGGGR